MYITKYKTNYIINSLTYLLKLSVVTATFLFNFNFNSVFAEEENLINQHLSFVLKKLGSPKAKIIKAVKNEEIWSYKDRDIVLMKEYVINIKYKNGSEIPLVSTALVSRESNSTVEDTKLKVLNQKNSSEVNPFKSVRPLKDYPIRNILEEVTKSEPTLPNTGLESGTFNNSTNGVPPLNMPIQ
jgi:hypothetical protein